MSSKKTQTIIRIPDELKNEILISADIEHRSLNQEIIEALKFYLNAKKAIRECR